MSTPSVPGHPQPQLDPQSDLTAAAAAARRKRMNLIAFILAIAIVSLLLRLTYYTCKETKALMFVGIPTAWPCCWLSLLRRKARWESPPKASPSAC
jgi:phosphatidylserine synthase